MEKTPRSYTKKALISPDRIRVMFDVVAKRYDLVNAMMTFGQDQRWRRLAAQSTQVEKGATVLDACTGTGDLALAVNQLTGAQVVGVDFSPDMLKMAEEKINAQGKSRDISFVQASVMELPFENATFDAITIGFGLRNTPDYKGALQEFYRVIKPGGKLVCLESSQPDIMSLRAMYIFYLSTILPFIGKIASNNYEAYKYFADSTEAFPPKKALALLMKEAGWDSVTYRSLFLGSVAIHIATKTGG